MASPPDDLREMADRVLAAMTAGTRGLDAEWTTADLAAALKVRPYTWRHALMEESLWTLSKGGLVTYRFRRRVGSPVWWLTLEGIEAAGDLTGATRHR